MVQHGLSVTGKCGEMYVSLRGCNFNIFLMDRNADVVARQKYANLVKSVKDSGGTVHIFSSLHVSGEREYFTLFIQMLL